MAELDREQLGERTQEPTELRLADARKRGQVARSMELASAASALAAAIALGLAGPGLLNEMTKMTATFLDGRTASLDVRSGELRALVAPAAGGTLKAAAGLLAACAVLAGLAAFVQVGPMAVAERVTPDWTRLSPSAGLGRLLSLVRAGTTLAKLAALAAIGYWSFRPVMARLLAAGTMEPRRLAGEAGSLAWAAALAVGGCLLALGLLDYLYEWWQHRIDLRMSRQEIRQERKATEGDWRVRHRRRDIGRELVTRIGQEQKHD
jgi:flagellar biosynthetic protein FlhB